MPTNELAYRNSKAVLWAFSGYDRFGKPTVDSTGVEITVRWSEGVSEGDEAETNRQKNVAYAKVDRDIAVGSRMWLGKLADWTDDGLNDVLIVTGFSKVNDIKGRSPLRTVNLMRFRDTLAES